MDIGEAVTSRDVYRAISSDKKFDVHKLNSLGAFLNNKVKYKTAKVVGEKVSDPRFEKISNESSRAINKRFCDVINSAFEVGEQIITSEFSLRYKSMNSGAPITKNYILKLLFALERHECLTRLHTGIYQKRRDIAEQEMTFVTRFIKAKKPQEVERKVPVNLPQIDGYATVKSVTLEKYIKEIKTLKLIVKAQQKELEVKDQFIQGLPRFDLPALDTEEYADLKKKYGIQ
jgi:hypothetical protein